MCHNDDIGEYCRFIRKRCRAESHRQKLHIFKLLVACEEKEYLQLHTMNSGFTDHSEKKQSLRAFTFVFELQKAKVSCLDWQLW